VTGDSKHVTIAVSDNGPGVPREERELIFEKFRRGAAAKESGNVGTGLGLAVVRAIVRAHRGKVDVRGEAPTGARFRIVLPRRHVEAT
jgi:signal transduction histidine kinase